MIRQIVREEVQRALASPREEPEIASTEHIVHQEIEENPGTDIKTYKTPKPLSNPRYRVQPRFLSPRTQYQNQGGRRDTNEWRTFEGKPICFHCGRPGHVVCYCRDRQNKMRKGEMDIYEESKTQCHIHVKCNSTCVRSVVMKSNREFENRAAIIVALRAGRSPKEIVDFLKLPKTTIYRVKKQFDEADSNKEGIATRKKHSRRSDRVGGEELVKNVKEKIDGNPGKSMRAIAKEMDVASMTIVRTFHEDLGLKSYALRKGQLLTENMKNNRKGKAAALLNNLKHDSFGMLRFFSDEKNFDVDQKVNPRNDRWICKDPSEIPVVMHTKFPASVMVLGVISSEGDVMPPHFFEKGLRMNADTYINVLETVVKPWMDMVAAGRKYVFQQDSAPAHKAKKTQSWLTLNVPSHWGPDIWPPNSPDCNPLDYYVWGVVERDVNKAPHTTIQSVKKAVHTVMTQMDKVFSKLITNIFLKMNQSHIQHRNLNMHLMYQIKKNKLDTAEDEKLAHKQINEDITNINKIEINQSKSNSQNFDIVSVRKSILIKNSKDNTRNLAKFNAVNDGILLVAMVKAAREKVKTSAKFYGLPLHVKELYNKYLGIKELYEWQDECLKLPALNLGENLIYTLPTSGGKTLVAEILIMKELLVKKKNALLILPFVSIVQEKVRSLSQFAVDLNFHIEEYAGYRGAMPPRKRRGQKRSIFIATIEKAHSLINSLIETQRLSEIGLIVIDELHMLGDRSHRGAALETLICKVKLVDSTIQFIGMSATLGKMDILQKFLNASIYAADFRPVKLEEYIKIDNMILRYENGDLTPVEQLNYKPDPASRRVDPDNICNLVKEVIPEHSCLIFCPTKKHCENVAQLLAKNLPKDLEKVHKDGKKILLQRLITEVGSTCVILRHAILHGVAYHHSGLATEERRLLEEAYLEGILCVLACTSTLAAGVNLPARVLDRLRFLPIKKMDQRTCIKFCVKNEIKCADAFRMLTVTYGEATLDRSNVYRWYKMFSEGREDVNDEERAGRPSTSTTDEKINEVEKMILANLRITVREFAEDLNISIGSCHSIFINDLGMRRVAAKFVPKLLNCDQKQHRMNIANEMLDFVRDDPNLLQRVITGDEAWVYGYDVETKAQSSQWKLPHEPRPKKARQVRSNVKVLLTVFFDCRGVVHHEFLPQGRTVNKEYYLQVMRNFREAIRQKRPDLWKNKNWLLHHNNAPAHTASKEELKKILKNDFLKCFEDWKNRWHKCIISHGDYFEGDKIELIITNMGFQCQHGTSLIPLAADKMESFNAEQTAAYDQIMAAVKDVTMRPKCFFIDGPGGSGKTYLYTTLMHSVRGMNQVVLPAATTGIAANLLKGGKTIHSLYGLQIPLNETSVSNIKMTTMAAGTLREAKPTFDDLGADLIEIPQELICKDDIVREIFGDTITPELVETMSQRAILCPKNDDVHKMNDQVMDLIVGDYHTYLSDNYVVSDSDEERNNFPVEFLNSVTPSGMPPHRLRLKVGCIIQLLRNLKKGLCNGTRFTVKSLKSNVIEAEVLTGSNKGDIVLIPRIDLAQSETGLPFIMERRQIF
ncbi:HELQ, partial [Cordylochernes scorpioides]